MGNHDVNDSNNIIPAAAAIADPIEGESQVVPISLDHLSRDLAGNVSERHVLGAVQKTRLVFVSETMSQDIIGVSLLAWWPTSTLSWCHVLRLPSSAITTTHHHHYLYH